MPKADVDSVKVVLHVITAILLAVLVYYGADLREDTDENAQGIRDNATRITALEATVYTHQDAKEDNSKLTEKLTKILANQAATESTLSTVRNQLTNLSGRVTHLGNSIRYAPDSEGR